VLDLAVGQRHLQVGDAESDAYLHEKVVVEQFKLLQPLLRTDPKQSLFSGLVASLAEG